jgi:hypothetical protein
MRLLILAGFAGAAMCLLSCSTSDDEPTREEIMEKGKYCCTHDGEATTPECTKFRRIDLPGGVLDVDTSGRTPAVAS